IAGPGHVLERRIQKLLPATANVVRGRAIASLEDEGARRNDSAAGELAVEAYPHETARPQQLEQDAPARPYIGQVMQHAAGIDQVEGSVDRFELEDIGLSVLDLVRQQRRRLPFCLAKAGEAGGEG